MKKSELLTHLVKRHNHTKGETSLLFSKPLDWLDWYHRTFLHRGDLTYAYLAKPDHRHTAALQLLPD